MAISLSDLRHSIIDFELSTHESNAFKATWLSENRFMTLILYIYYLARTPEIGQGLGRILSCGARKQEQT